METLELVRQVIERAECLIATGDEHHWPIIIDRLSQINEKDPVAFDRLVKILKAMDKNSTLNLYVLH